MNTQPLPGTQQWLKVQEQFRQAAAMGGEQRRAFIEESCGDDAGLRAELLSLLEARTGGLSLLDRSPIGDTSFAENLAAAAELAEREPEMPQRVGSYRILRVIGSGGMGIVYEAEQAHPHRTVAVKVLSLGIGSRTAMRRFEHESQLLGRLRHPGIAQVYEAGAHVENGRKLPYFVMEYIPNARPVTRFTRENNLRTRDRLKLFADVCDAVYHGHQKGVIHRDLKPGNILVDAEGRARVIDFGVARSTGSDVAATTMHTDARQLVGTLQYMSPEQCDGDAGGLDVRSDVYALGVILHELLCDRLPYDVSGQTVYDAMRVIREAAPPNPSAVSPALRGDLETIVRKAMEKNRDRRYGSAADLAADVRRYLEGDAILARPATRGYRLRVFARQNKGLVAGVAAACVALLLGMAGAAAGLAHAVRQKEEARDVTEFLTRMLESGNLANTRGRPLGVRELLDQAARRLDVERAFAGRPLVEAQLRMAIGNTYKSLKNYEPEAERHLSDALAIRRRVLGEDDAAVAESLHDLAVSLLWKPRQSGRGPEVVPMFRKALEIRRRRLGDDHADTLESMHSLGTSIRDGMEFRAPGYKPSGHEGAEGDALLREVVQRRQRTLGNEHPDTAMARVDLGISLLWQERYVDAEPLLRDGLAALRRGLGNDHPHVPFAARHLASLLSATGRLDDAELLSREALTLERGLGAAVRPVHLITILLKKKDFHAAEVLLREDIAAHEERDDGRYVVGALSQLGECLIGLKRHEEAEQALLRGKAIIEALPTEEPTPVHPRVRRMIFERLVRLYEAWDKPQHAAEARRQLSAWNPADPKPEP